MKIAIVDEQRAALSRLGKLLRRQPGVEVALVAESAGELISRSQAVKPDAAFFDMERPGTPGLKAVPKLARTMPVVFVSGRPEDAVRAFDVGARDYLLKPVRSRRLAQTLSRLRGDIAAGQARPGSEPMIRVPAVDGEVLVPVTEVICISAEDHLTRLRTVDGRRLLVWRSLKEWQAILPPDAFVLAHRKELVSLGYIRAIDTVRRLLTLEGQPAPVRISRRRFKEVLGQWRATSGDAAFPRLITVR